MRAITSLARMRRCGHQTVSDGGVTIGVKTNPDGTLRAGYGGVATCASVWSCASCSVVIATRRAEEIADVIRAVDAVGGTAFMLTLTMRHALGDRLGWSRDERRRWESLETCRKARNRAAKKGQPLNVGRIYRARHWTGGTPDPDAGPQNPATGHICDLAVEEAERAELEATRGCWDAIGEAWGAVTSGGTWVSDQDKHGGMLGWAKVVETTDGTSGWHCHLHVLVCFADEVALEDAQPIARRMFRRWQRSLRAHGFDASGDFGADGKIPGWDLRRAQLGDNAIANYFVKLAHEVASGHAKEGRRPGGRTPMQLAADAVETYDEATIARWWQWESASEGRRQLTWSGGTRSLRALAGIAETTDEEIVEDHAADERLAISAEVWGWVRANDQKSTVLDVAELGGIEGLAQWFDQHGQSYVRGAGLAWDQRPDETPGQAIEGWDGTPGWRRGTTPRDEGVGVGWQLVPPAVLRERDAAGRPQRRPSDRPPRWSDDAHAVARGRVREKLSRLSHHRTPERAGDDG